MNEIVYDIPFEDYKAAPGINSGILNKAANFSMKHVKAMLDGKLKDDSDSKSFGRAFHSWILEDKQDFVIHPLQYPSAKGEMKDWTMASKWCQEWASSQSKEVFSHDEADSLLGMVESVRSNPEIVSIMDGAKSEVSLFVMKNGIQFKARIDTLPKSGPIIDFKSAVSAKPEKFVRQAFDNGYFLQAAFYLDLLAELGDKRQEFWFVPVEKTYPYATSIIKVRDGLFSFKELGRRRYRDALAKIMACVKSGIWPSYDATEPEMVATAWMNKELEEAA